MAESTVTNDSQTLDLNNGVLRITGKRKTMSFDKMYNLHKGLVPETQEDAGSQLGATTQVAKDS